jgi:hypothetical protein
MLNFCKELKYNVSDKKSTQSYSLADSLLVGSFTNYSTFKKANTKNIY